MLNQSIMYHTYSTGTPAFQCPEIANGEDTYRGFSVDIWSCGVTLFNLVTGTLPFEAENIYLLFQTIGKGIYTIPDEIEPHLAALLNGLLHIDKNARFTIEQIKQHDWFRRRPPRTFDFLPFPPLALNRFQTFTMYDYLTELHQPMATTIDTYDEQIQMNHLPDTSISLVKASSDRQQKNLPCTYEQSESMPRRTRLSILNCGCNRTTSGNNLHQSSQQHSDHRRLCSLS
jgi:serine/threonine protein kinase